MALSPREIPQFFPRNLSSSNGQESLRGPIDMRRFTFGLPNVPNFNFQGGNVTRLHDQNITTMLQNWLLSNLRDLSGTYAPISDLSFRQFPGIPAMISPLTEQQRYNFILQDLHEKYRKLLGCSLSGTPEKFRIKNEYSDRNFSPFRNPYNPGTFSGQVLQNFPNFVGNLPFSFPPSTFSKNDRKVVLSNPFGHILDGKEPGDVPTIPTTPIHQLKSTYTKNENASSPRQRVAVAANDNPMKDKKSHKCIYCGKLYSRKYGLKIHIRTHTGYKPLKCKVCGRPFGDPSNLNKHVRLHAEGDTPYRCEYCGKVLVRRRDLERHIKSRHPSSSNKMDSYSESWKVAT